MTSRKKTLFLVVDEEKKMWLFFYNQKKKNPDVCVRCNRNLVMRVNDKRMLAMNLGKKY